MASKCGARRNLTLEGMSPPIPVSVDTIKLVTEGRTTGLPHIVMVRFVYLKDAFLVLAGKGRSDWVVNGLRSGRAKIRSDELVFDVSVRYATDGEKAAALDHFGRKYGRRLTREWYSSPTQVCLALIPQGPPRVRGAVRGESETKVDLRQWQMRRRDYYQEVSEAFDSASEEYDFTISHNFINRWIRKRSIEEVLRYSKADDVLLEIGCGTGAEAIEISKKVDRIVATDISDKMIEILRKKVRTRGLDHKITPAKVGASQVSEIGELIGGEKVNLAYSLNGALNCEPRIAGFPRELSSVLRRSGYFICSIRNTICLSEAISHAAVLQFGKMAPRKKQPQMVSVGGMDIPSTYYSPSTFARFFSESFDLRKVVGLPAILPPAYLSGHYLKVRRLVSLERIESILSDHFPFNRYGDQTLFVFQKR
jgi:SAM-dependent methyltransferase